MESMGPIGLRWTLGCVHTVGRFGPDLYLCYRAGALSRNFQSRIFSDQAFSGLIVDTDRNGLCSCRRGKQIHTMPMNGLWATGGLWMLLSLGVLTVSTGLPVWTLLLGVSSLFATIGCLFGVVELNILAAMPSRLIGLLDNDLLQALPLYVAVGILLQKLSLADAWFSVVQSALKPLGGAPGVATLSVGALIAPMNGSVASSANLISRLVAPRLRHLAPAKAIALTSAAATIGVVIPPSLVLILLGDAMLRAHTEASNLPGFVMGQSRIINTQDVFHSALLPGLGILLLWALIALWHGRNVEPSKDVPARKQLVLAGVSASVVVLLLAGVFQGKFFAVEAAATGGVLLAVMTLMTRTLSLRQWGELLDDAMNLTGALMALLVGATVFSLIFRLFGTDRWILEILVHSPFSPMLTSALVLVLVGVCASVLDAFEMIFVVLPIVAPALIAMLGDAQQSAVLLLLVLQASFLVPPMGYAVMMARSTFESTQGIRSIFAALSPYILVQVGAFLLVFFVPSVVHQLDSAAVQVVPESEEEVIQKMREMSESPASKD
jgi:tripartite ATP-independent transporter DctM subunit